MIQKIIFSITLLLAMIPSSFAGVNLKNGNFYISYTDIIIPGGGKKLQVTRTYNSKSTEKGWFGFGWGSKYETFLVVSADGSVVVHENGSGAATRFVPKTAVDPKAAAQRIVEKMRSKKSVSVKVAASLVKKLSEDAELRQIYARRYGVKSQIANGTVLYSNARGLQQIKKTKSGYLRKFSNGTLQYFNRDGKVTKIKEKDGYEVSLTYDKKNLKSVKDSLGKQLYFNWYTNGLVKNIWAEGAAKTEYKYKGDDLVYSKDVGGNVYQYEFDQNHNLTAIVYQDGTKMKIGYEPKTYFVSSITTKDGEETKYKYESNPKDPNFHYWTIVSKKAPGGKWVNNRYEYEIKTKPDGERYTHRILTIINGLNTETIYTECCGLPKKITRGKHVTNFEYNADGLLTKKTSTTGDYVELAYDKKFKKITKVVDKKGTTTFSYDKFGNLEVAQNKYHLVKLIYDLKNRIKTMIDKDRKSNKVRTMKFTYNAQGKPEVITMVNTGQINVTYDSYGEIKKVDSKQGSKMALQVTQAFQSLLAIVRPAGVSLSL